MTANDAIAEELRALLHEQHVEFKHRDDPPAEQLAPGKKAHPSLLDRLAEKYEQRPVVEQVSGSSSKPHSQPPTDDYPLSLASEIRKAVTYWLPVVHPALDRGRTPDGRRVRALAIPFDRALALLPELAADHPLGEEVLADLRSYHGRTKIELGLIRAPYPLRLAAATCDACKQPSLMISPDTGLIYCGTGGPNGCHDDHNYPSCRMLCLGDPETQTGGCGDARNPDCPWCWGNPPVSCRVNDRSMRHAWRLGNDQLHALTMRLAEAS